MSNTLDSLRLRPIVADDLETLYEFQCDPDANAMAALIPRTRERFMEVWTGVVADPNVLARAILLDDRIVGTITRFHADDLPSVGYWVDKPYWGRGIASRALTLFLPLIPERPLHARVAAHNAASLRVLQKHHFRITARQSSPATDRYLACEEVLLVLE